MTSAARLSPLDGSFLRLEDGDAHMHVGWSAVFGVPDDALRPTLEVLRARVASRLPEVPWCRWRLEPAPLGLAEPRWVDDDAFDLTAHVRLLGAPGAPMSYTEFEALRDEVLSEPLDRSRALWQIFLVPRLEDGRVGMVGKIHHALVDGIAALQVVRLVADAPPDTPFSPSAVPDAGPPQGRLGWAVDGLTRTAGDGVRAARAAATAAIRPRGTARAAVQGTMNLLRASREDVLPRAPASALNVPIGPRRTLVGYHARREDVRAARAGGGTPNDIGLTVVAGALRELAIRRAEIPEAPLKVMVPVSMRRIGESGAGNRIAMVQLRLPVDAASRAERLGRVREQTARLRGSGRADGAQTLYGAGGLLPAPLRSPVVRAMASPRVFNLTVSNSPAPRGTINVLGCEMQELYSVVPIPPGHALAIGLVRYRQELFFGCYADPEALPDIGELPALLETELRGLGDAARLVAGQRGNGRPQADPSSLQPGNGISPG
jgi:WS/DGAT/MGAT family acyltransferase